MSGEELHLSGHDVRPVAVVLANETCLRIMSLLSKRDLDVSTLAEKLNLTEPTVSVDIQELQNLGIVTVTYEKGKRGIRKICKLAKDRICIKLR
jgi:predicted transcriptional regulator